MSDMTVKLKIDGVEVTVPEGITILQAATDNGIKIPTLCALEGLSSSGGCRLCLVKLRGHLSFLQLA
jgi:NADH dehydrogenase/NADH:ubiquinone oxidoreductase subunit G